MPSAQQRASKEAQRESAVSQTRRELCQQSRDLSGLVKQVIAILPQFSPDLVCEALIQKDEDVEATVEYLLSSSFETKVGKKKKKKAEGQGATSAPEQKEEPPPEAAEDAGAEAFGENAQEEMEERGPLLPSEKQALKVKKKLREIERIEEKLARNEKVDKMQLPKLEKKGELEWELMRLQEAVLEEERLREQEREQARLEAELERQRLQAEADARAAAAAAAAAEAAEVERQRRLAEEVEQQRYQQHLLFQQQQQELQRREEERRQQQDEQQRRQPEAPAVPAAGSKGRELLSILHKVPEPKSYSQAEQLAQDLGGGRLLVQRFPGSQAASAARAPAAQPPAGRAAQTAPAPRGAPPQGAGGGGGSGQHAAPQQSRGSPPAYYGQEHRHQQYHQAPRGAAPYQSGGGGAEKGGGGGGGGLRRWENQPPWGAASGSPEEASSGQKVDETSFMNEYSTPLDVNSIPLEKRRLAEKIAKEIEGSGHSSEWYDDSRRYSGYGSSGRGGGDWYEDRRYGSYNGYGNRGGGGLSRGRV